MPTSPQVGAASLTGPGAAEGLRAGLDRIRRGRRWGYAVFVSTLPVFTLVAAYVPSDTARLLFMAAWVVGWTAADWLRDTTCPGCRKSFGIRQHCQHCGLSVNGGRAL